MKHFIILLLSLFIGLGAFAQDPAITQYKFKVDTSITTKTAPKSITPLAVGGRMKDLADLVPRELKNIGDSIIALVGVDSILWNKKYVDTMYVSGTNIMWKKGNNTYTLNIPASQNLQQVTTAGATTTVPITVGGLTINGLSNGTETDVLIVTAGGQVKKRSLPNIYNSDGALTGDRALDGNNHFLHFSGLSEFRAGAVSTSLAVTPAAINLQGTNSSANIGDTVDLYSSGGATNLTLSEKRLALKTLNASSDPIDKFVIDSAGAMYVSKYKNNSGQDSVLSTDENGKVKLKYVSSANIYNTSGILTDHRLLTGKNSQYLLQFDSLAAHWVYAYDLSDPDNYKKGGAETNPGNTFLYAQEYESPLVEPYSANMSISTNGSYPKVAFTLGKASNFSNSQANLDFDTASFHLSYGQIKNGYLRDSAIVVEADAHNLFLGTHRFYTGTGVTVGNKLRLSADLNDNYVLKLQNDSISASTAFPAVYKDLMSVDKVGNVNGTQFNATSPNGTTVKLGFTSITGPSQIATLSAPQNILLISNPTGPGGGGSVWLDVGGGVGINTSGPSAKLHVNGTVRFDNVDGAGSDQTGDLYYRSSSGVLTALHPGTEGQVVTLNSSLLPVYATPSTNTLQTVTDNGNVTTNAIALNDLSNNIPTTGGNMLLIRHGDGEGYIEETTKPGDVKNPLNINASSVRITSPLKVSDGPSGNYLETEPSTSSDKIFIRSRTGGGTLRGIDFSSSSTTFDGWMNINSSATPIAALEVHGRYAGQILTISANTTLGVYQIVRITTGGITVTLPSAASSFQNNAGVIYKIRNEANTSCTISTVLVDGTPTTTLPANTAWEIYSDGTDWRFFR